MRQAPPQAPQQRAYTSQRERDAALEQTYELSRSALEILGDSLDSGSTLAAVAAQAAALADDFWRHRAAAPESDPHQALLAYEARHFGRQLEPAAHGVLSREVSARFRGSPRSRGRELFVSWAEEQHWTGCAIEAGGKPGPGDSALDFCERVIDLATGRRRMAPAEIEARREELRRQAREIGAEAPGGVA